MYKSLPRLSRVLRAHTDLELLNDISSCLKSTELIKNNIDNSSGWKSIVNFLSVNNTNGTTIKKKLTELWSLVRKEFGTEEDGRIVDNAVIILLNMFLNANTVSNSHLATLREKFGDTLTLIANKMLAIICEIRPLLNSKSIDYLQCMQVNNKSFRKRWGDHISVSIPEYTQSDTSFLIDLKPIEPNQVDTIQSFSMKYLHNPTDIKNNNKSKTSSALSKWLENDVNTKQFAKLIELLKSDRSKDELQNDLFELLKFENFDLIQEILQNRKKIVQSASKMLLLNKSSTISRQNELPVIASTVVVQSELEKNLKKQNRRDEKKINRLLNSLKDANDNQFESEKLDPLQMRLRQQVKLLESVQTQPILNHNKVKKTVPSSSVIQYPYVFDNQRDIKSHAGFVGGNKITLPTSSERINCKEYEEVKIPASDPPPLQIGQNRIKIADLDDIGQLVFSKTSELNRIQSIVYPLAYHSNENLLVCAPTGAGKTNVAMLTIIRAIRSHMSENGTIHREQFKIVYIAPMKALASEMVENFASRLKSLHIIVKELTGDMQLTKSEMQETQILVTTPEKWDVVTRKGVGDVELISLVKLLIIDEVHLLHGDRGPVVEALVARTLRLVESTQSMIRIVGLSATLPNYIDVANFLRVNPMKGLFFFDSRFRPVPLQTNFVGVKSVKPLQMLTDMDKICYDKCIEMLQHGHQIMIFVHARNATARTAGVMRELAQQNNTLSLFLPESSASYGLALKSISKSRNKQLVDLFQCGLAMHHAGMLRTDRRMVENYFAEGFIRVLVCTSTLAWGVNLPAHAVIIKGTDVYNSKCGSFTDLGILDVLQIFGRAGRPQYDKSGVATIITGHDKLNHYLSLLTNQFPIESNFIECLADNLNAEITLGTITNINEAIEWLSYTYLFVRMRINPHVYGIEYSEVSNDPLLEAKRRNLLIHAAMNLDKAKMIRYNQRTGDLNITDLGRTASHFYIKYDTVEIFNDILKPFMSEAEVLAMISQAQEFQQLKVRDDELDELDELKRSYCHLTCYGGSENVHGKVNILMQTYLSRGVIRSFSLISDMSYIVQNVARICRALFTIVLRNNNAILSSRILIICKMFEKQMWEQETPLRQFTNLGNDILEKIEARGLGIYTLKEIETNELGSMLRNQKYANTVIKCANELPFINMSADIQPITRTVLRIRVTITTDFSWNDRIHGKHSQNFWLWIEDSESNYIYHSEYVSITRKLAVTGRQQELVMTIPLREPLPPQYYIRAISDVWLGSNTWIPLSFQHLVLPEQHPPLTELLPLNPLPINVLNNKNFESLYKFTHFNPIQTQIFHCVYHTDNNMLLGAPTGSGKTIVAELAIFRIFQNYPNAKIVYIAPLKALVKERVEDWKVRIEKNLRKKVVELTGDITPDICAIKNSHLIVTTPEKWDGISRSWQTRDYVRDVALIVIDEIHLLGEDRGPVLEVIISRINFISSHTKKRIRVIGLSTALANAQDLANWLGITKMGMYNFKPSVRPVPLSVHINGFTGKHYCPRMATMNRPTYQAIRTYSPCTPALVFVSSRRQTRLTALDLITFLASEDNPKQFIHMAEQEMSQVLETVKDTNLKFILSFGIGIHHAGLQERDRKVVEELFLHRKIQILIATSTLAWGVNLPAHLVVIKGTEFFDGKVKKYVDMPITDVLQMMGRAGRPQFDNEGVAVVLVHDVKKNFYKKFLYDPFPVESNLLNVLPDHINAEIVAGTVLSKQSILDYLTWTFFFRRLLKNPTFYHLEKVEPSEINVFLSKLVESLLFILEKAGCVSIIDNDVLYPTSVGRISSFYYLSYQTMTHFLNNIEYEMTDHQVLKAVCDCYEFDQHPVRHNEDIHNADLAKLCRYKPDSLTYDSPYTKTFLLMQAHFSHLSLPNSDYLTDTKSVLDQSIRILQAMIDFAAENGWLQTTLKVQQLMQCIIQARWVDDPVVMTLPNVNEHNFASFNNIKEEYSMYNLLILRDIALKGYDNIATPLRDGFSEQQIEQIYKVLLDYPEVSLVYSLSGTNTTHKESNDFIAKAPSRDDWICVKENEEYALNINLIRKGNKKVDSIYCPKFPKGKNEGWFLTLGTQCNGELIALKRITIRGNKTSTKLCFTTPETAGRIIYTLYLFSDCYLGLDQQYNIQLNVVNQKSEIY